MPAKSNQILFMELAKPDLDPNNQTYGDDLGRADWPAKEPIGCPMVMDPYISQQHVGPYHTV